MSDRGPSDRGLNRRDALRAAGLGLAALGLGVGGGTGRATAAVRQPAASGAAARRGVRLAHLTDIHVQPELRADAGLKACLDHVAGLTADDGGRPDMIVTGGDLIFDSFAQPLERTQALWELHARLFKDHAGLPVQHTMGNHDIWGWNKSKSKTAGNETRWGKRWFCEMAGRDRTYQAFDLGNWRIIQLDSVQPDPRDPNGYIGRIDDEQMAWLDAELAAIPAGRHALVVSHIPILSMCAVAFERNAKADAQRWEVGAGVMHIDAMKLHDKFVKSGKVRLCVSGHIHKLDRVDFGGVTYMCNGAVSGAWWKGPRDRCEEGYALLDLFDDGGFSRDYRTYGWKAEA